MTKIVTWWKRFSFWNKVRSVITAILASTEIALFAEGASEAWKWFALAFGLIIIFTTHIVQDANNNGIVDLFEDDENKTNNIDDNL